jgi:hypothetical protein
MSVQACAPVPVARPVQAAAQPRPPASYGQLRTTLDQVRAAVGVPAIAYTDPDLTAGVSLIKVAHIEQLRAGVK